jgi:NADP-dependent 3-hydroxy acid dehydrogenase YdfG
MSAYIASFCVLVDPMPCPASASTLSLDVTDSHSIAALGDAVANVDILVNNAGIVHSAGALEQTEAQWDSVVDTNLKGASS